LEIPLSDRNERMIDKAIYGRRRSLTSFRMTLFVVSKRKKRRFAECMLELPLFKSESPLLPL